MSVSDEELRNLLKQKKSKDYYCEKLKISKENLEERLIQIRNKSKTVDKPKILLLDIETSPLLAYVYQKEVWKAKINHEKVVSDWFMLTWAAKWLDESKVYSEGLTSSEAILENDKRIILKLWELLNEADIIIAHNGDQFDIPNINTRFVLHKLPPPSPYKQIDTKKVAKLQFGFTHNSLDGICKFFGIEGKIDTDFQLWKDCIMGNKKALKDMETYNQNDVIILEKVYYLLRPYIKGHPNLDLYTDTENSVCTSCGKEDLKVIKGKYFYTQSVRYPIFRCSCGSISRSKKGEPFLNKKVISAIPR